MKPGTSVVLVAVFAAITLNLASLAHAAEPRVLNYRNGGTGAFPDADPPLDWSNARNVEWSWEAPAFDLANSSPIIVDDPSIRGAGKVFTLIAPHGLVCLDKVTGKELWRRESHAADSQTNAVAAEQSLKMLNRLRLLRLMVLRLYESWTEPRVHNSLKSYHAELDRYGPNAPQSFRQWVATLDRLAADATQNEEKYKAEIKQLEESLPAEIYPGSALKIDKKGHGIGWVCAAPPASDGKRVFAIFHPGLVVCYDLDGNRQWVHLISNPEGRAPLLSWGVGGQAPVPVDGKLLVQQGDELQCLDAATGKVLWRRNH
jgi:hypothetical protein